MIPILFKENETNFNSNGIGFLNETINYEVTEERNGAFELELEYPVSGKWFKELKDFRLILAKPNDTDEDHLFRIYEIVKDLASQTVNIYATTRSNDLGGNLVQGVTVNNETPQLAMNKMKANLIQPTDYKFVSDIQTKSSTEWIRRNPLNCIAGEEGSLVNYWGGEIKRTNDTIYLYSRRGRDKVTLIRQGKNLEGFELTSSTKGMITRILPFFTYTPEGKDDEVTITGSIVDSPLVNNYPVKYITPVDYSSDDTIDSLAKLNAAAKSYFAYQNPDCDKPSVNMQIDLLQLSDSSEYAKFKDLEHIGLTDTVEVWVEKFDVDVEVKINELTYNGSLGQVTNIVAGSQPHTLYDDVKKDYKDDFSYLEKYVNSMEHGIRNTIQIASDGKSTIFRGYTEPPIDISKLNDLWFKELGSGEVEVYIFDGAYWQPYITAGLNEAVKAEVRAILAQAEADRVKAEADFEQAVIEAGAYTEQKAKEFDAKLVIVNQEITSVKSSADQSVIKADQAIKDAGFAQVDASAAKVSATNALSAANAAKTDASSALTKANSAVTDATSALTRVGAVEVTTGSLTTSYDALTKTVALKADQTTVDGINGKVTTQGLAITANATAVGLKADKTLVDTINSTVSKHTTDIKATADGLKLKADSSVVNTLSGTVTTHTTQIKAASDGLALKADSSVVNTIKGTVDTHSTQISANSQAITARLTSAQVETILTGKKYVNETTLSATSAGLTAQITQVSNDLGNLEIGGTNLLLNTANLQSETAANNLNINVMKNTPEVMVLGEEYTLSFDLKADTKTTSPNIFLATGLTINKVFNFETGWTRQFVTFIYNGQSYQNKQIYPHFYPTGTMMKYVKNFKLEKSNKATDWSPAPEDMATVERVVTIEANINGINTTVAAKADKTQITQLSNQISTKVESSTYNSKMTQLDQSINLRVVAKDVTDAILSDKTIKDTRSDNQLPQWYFDNYPRQTVEEFKYRNIIGAPGSTTYGQLTTKVLWSHTSGGAITQIFSSADGVFQRKGNSAATAWLAWEQVAEVGNLVAQINLSPKGVLIQGKNIQLDGDVVMHSAFITRLDTQTLNAVTANIASIRTKILTTDVVLSTMIKSDTALITKLFATDANVSILTAKTAFVNSVKAITISADKITAGTLNANNVSIINLNVSKLVGDKTNFVQSAWNAINSSVTVDGSKLMFSGKYTSNWDGTSKVRDINTILENGMLRIRNIPDNQTLYFSNNGISTMIDGSGMAESGEAIASGTIQFFDRRYGATRGITVQSHQGDVALRTTGAYQDIILDSARDVLLLNPSGIFEVYGQVKTGGVTHRSDSYNLYLGAQEEVRITNRDFYNGGKTAYQRMRASIGYFNGVEANTYNDANFFYIGAPSEVRIVASFDNNTVYRPIRGEDSYFNSVITNTLNGGYNLYLGASGEVRVTNTLGNNNGKPQYNRLRASVMFSTGLYTNEDHGGHNLYLGAVGEVRVVAGVDSTGTYKAIRATNFYQSSSRDFKTNIINFNEEALSIINGLTVVEYNLKDELQHGIYRRELGFIAEDSAYIATEDMKAINSYKTSALMFKGIQELHQTYINHDMLLNEHDQRLTKLEKENKELKQKIEKMESAA